MKKVLVVAILLYSLIWFNTPSHAKTKTQVVNRVYASAPGYVHQQFYTPSGKKTFFQRTWSANFNIPGGIITEPTATVNKGTNINFSFKMLANLVFQQYDMGKYGRANLKTAYAQVSIVQFDRLEHAYESPMQYRPLYTFKKYALTEKKDIGKTQPWGMMDFNTALPKSFDYTAPKTGKYALLFELYDLTQAGADRDKDGYYAYYGIQNVTYNY